MDNRKYRHRREAKTKFCVDWRAGQDLERLRHKLCQQVMKELYNFLR